MIEPAASNAKPAFESLLYRSFCKNNHIEYNPLITESLEDLITMAIIKSKLYRVDYLRYKAIKNNNLIKMLCKK